ncbi:TPA: S41 family peptidase [Elizabethkingia anophelis]
MKRIYIKKISFTLGILLVLTIINSCVREDVISTKEPIRYTKSDIKSYGDLFRFFWTTMDERYNYFYEQKRKDGLDWDAVYREYNPKFNELKSFRNLDYSARQREEDRDKAKQYFTDIINPIIDRHFVTRILFPQTNIPLASDTISFYGNMKFKNKKEIINYKYMTKVDYMADKLMDDYLDFSGNFLNDKKNTSYKLLAGRLKSNPDIFYLTFPGFNFILGGQALLFQKGKYFSPNMDNPKILTAKEVENSPLLNSIQNSESKERTKKIAIDVLNAYNKMFISNEVKTFNYQMDKFINDDIISDELLNAITKVEEYKVPSMSNEVLGVKLDLPIYFVSQPLLITAENTPYLKWFTDRINEHLIAYGYVDFLINTQVIKNATPLYKKLLNPLRQGNIKKLIIDLRDNGGGAALDINNFTSRFITKSATFAYQRTKEGTGRFNYTQWVPQVIKPHRFAMPKDIPIVILTDEKSASMSEISTLAWKSQGKQVISVGDYSSGATAGLTTDYDGYNGGLNSYSTRIQYLADHILFYVPAMATKDMNGEVIEGIGIKPDIYVTPPSREEVDEMKNSPKTHIDRTLSEAIKVLSK